MNICRFTLFLYLSATIEGLRLYIKYKIINTIYGYGVLIKILCTLSVFISSHIYHNSNKSDPNYKIIRYIDISVALCAIAYHICFYAYFEAYKYSLLLPIAYLCALISFIIGHYVSNDIVGHCCHAFVEIFPYIACMDTYDFVLHMIAPCK